MTPTYINPLNTAYIEEMESQYRLDPNGLDPTWRSFFDGFYLRGPDGDKKAEAPSEGLKADLNFEIKVLELIQGYRELGYLIADVNPLQRGVKTHPLLKLEKFGLSEADLDRLCSTGSMLGLGPVPLRTIVETLKTYYCSPASVEFGHIEDPPSRLWIQERVEKNYLRKPLAPEIQRRCLEELIDTEVFETFLHKRFVGQKRFSVEGNDVIIPMLDHLIDEATLLGCDEILVAMAHRGRLNVLANIFKKDLRQMFAEFSGNLDTNVGDGDVKYHMGFSQKVQTMGGKAVHLSLTPNPSHLEAVNSVVMGVARAKQKLKNDHDKTRILAVMLHGDASFSGQGSIYELLNLSELKGYTIGGTIHIIVNNQIGFTTDPSEARSTPQATDVAKMLEFPIFRVNADEPDAALRCVELAVEFRYKFKRDVVIDVIGYRRYGHNESDEPSFTQPLLYKAIHDHPRVRQIYGEKLMGQGLLSPQTADQEVQAFTQQLEAALDESKKTKVSPNMASFGDRWQSLHKPTEKEIFKKIATAVPLETLKKIGQGLITVPEGFHLHPKGKKFLDDRQAMLEGSRGVDWSFAEALSIGSLVAQGIPVRLAGQDSERGTFSQRHAVFHDVETGKKYNPFNHLQERQADFEVINSPLNEFACLGFEFGESMADPNKLTLWEAQFGDFVNAAQVIVDQFIVCSAYKWQRYSGITLLLPHGYEGQGPEHSSGRLSRFLIASAQDNIQVVNMTTPAQYFHILRRQMLRSFRLPLIILSPKSLLRNPLAVSSLEEFHKGSFRELIDDPDPALKEKATRIVLCGGKIYYDLLEARQKAKNKDVPLIRVEQFHPFPKDAWKQLFSAYPHAKEIVWCQEGPKNQEGWLFMTQYLPSFLQPSQTLIYVGRAAQASPADSYMSLHQKEQKRIVMTALGEI